VSDTIKIQIEIPAPPEGWGEVEYRKGLPGDYRLDCGIWFLCDCATDAPYPVARKLTPLWTPPLELVEVLKPGWLTRDCFHVCALHGVKPQPKGFNWTSNGPEWRLNAVNPDLLPPLTIPWEKCCFKIGEPKE
jgi:hypothetical protein